MKVITCRTHSVTVYKPCWFTFPLFFSSHQQMESGGSAKAVLLGVCPGILCSLLIFKLTQLGPQGDTQLSLLLGQNWAKKERDVQKG